MNNNRVGSARRGVVWLAAAIAGSLAFGACSSSPSDSSGGVGGNDGELVAALPFPITGLDLTGPLSGDRSVLTINRQLFDALTSVDDASGKLEPRLAASWKAVDDKTWSFTLRSDAKFHDGTPVTAEDAKASIEALQKAATPLAPVFSGVESVEAKSPTELVLHTSRTLGALPRNVALFGIAPKDKVSSSDFNQNPIGSGPFKFVSFSEDELKLVRNDDYWGDKAKVKSLVFRQIPEATARVAALQTGEVDLTWNIPPTSLSALKGDSNLTTKSVPGFLNYEVLINWKRPPFDKLEARQALAHATDAASIIKGVLGGLGSPARAPLAQSIFGATSLEPFAYDNAKATSLAADSGLAGKPVTMLLRPQETENQVALALISQWAKAGIKVKPDIKEMGTWTDAYVEMNFDLALTIRPTLTGDADYTLGRLYTTDANRVPCANPELDTLIKEGGGSTEESARKAGYDKALNYTWTQLCGIYPIDVHEAFVWNNNVRGFVPAPSSIPDFANVSVTE